MKQKFPIFMFIALQLASIAVVILWVVWSASDRTHVMWLLQGILLMIPVIGGATVIFIYWTKASALDSDRVDFISSVSHELLTPLSSIQLYLDTMRLRELRVEQQQEFLCRMDQDVERLSSLIARILAASRAESGRTRYHFEACDLSMFLKDCITSQSKLLEQATLKLNIEDGCWGRIDKESFQVLVKNLLQNAVRYSPSLARITIDLKKVRDKLLLAISDQGEGIEHRQLKAVFRLFYRASRKQGGTGLGLYIVKNIVRDHKGKVWAESAGRGSGASFKVLLPSIPAL